jgi:hypothetical protein
MRPMPTGEAPIKFKVFFRQIFRLFYFRFQSIHNISFNPYGTSIMDAHMGSIAKNSCDLPLPCFSVPRRVLTVVGSEATGRRRQNSAGIPSFVAGRHDRGLTACFVRADRQAHHAKTIESGEGKWYKLNKISVER